MRRNWPRKRYGEAWDIGIVKLELLGSLHISPSGLWRQVYRSVDAIFNTFGGDVVG